MNEARAILRATSQLREAGIPFVVATVVNVRGSSYRRPGARLVATAERRVAGSVSGGCLEKDLVRTAFWRTRSGPAVVRYDSSESDSPQASTGCGGEVDVLLERAGGDSRARDPMALVERALTWPHASALATVYRSDTAHVPIGTRWCLGPRELVSYEDGPGVPPALRDRIAAACEAVLASRRPLTFQHATPGDGGFDALVEPLVPPPHVFVFGAGFDALPVVEAVVRLGWSATVWEASAHVETRDRFAPTGATVIAGDLERVRAQVDASEHALAVVMGHDVDQDRAALGMLLASRASYIGVLGPRHRTARLAPEVQLADSRVHAPVGLDLGAETPDEIALAVTAEMLANVRGKTGHSLRTRRAIHDAASTR